ncbi:MAG: tetrahydrofolate dehydrogenase/cyclohydrolase catalytic domain-containing protein [Thermoplasmata archaeon]
MTVRLEGKPVAEALDRATKQAVEGRGGRPVPSLVSVHRGVESPFRFYLKRQAKAASALGIAFRDEALGPGEGPTQLEERIRALDRAPDVHGVLVEHPLPAPFDFLRAIEELRPEKDVDGVGPRNLGRLAAQRPLHVPAVAMAAFDIARHYRLPLDGERVAVVGRSETVGRPLALLLSGRPPGGNATVTLVHSKSPDLKGCLSPARTIFSCVGHPGLLDRAVVPQGAHVIDVGVSSVPDPARPGAVRAVGDADAESLEGWAASLTPVPGGVGPVTVAELMTSTVRAWRLETGTLGEG